MWEIDPELVTETLPRVLWIELTSKCPFDCIFCSRKMLRGDGQHMPFALYRSLIEQLDRPHIIRLNYSGESIHYPHLIEAIELAARTGAQTELVSAFASITTRQTERLARSGLDRLSISLHTMNDAQFREIYGFGSLEATKSKLAEFLRLRAPRTSPLLDFAFVAMERNLDQIACVAEFARASGVNEITIYPVLRRDPIPCEFPEELDGSQRLRAEFRTRLLGQVAEARRSYPEMQITVANPDAGPPRPLAAVPGCYPGVLPPDARIRTCDQSPWDTMHVLANGDVVSCEVHDKTPLGNLAEQSLREIWQGAKYGQFRRAYCRGDLAGCRECPWKVAYRPAPLQHWISGSQGGIPQLLQGWFPEESNGLMWSQPRATAVLATRRGFTAIRLRGVLPPDRLSGNNRLTVWCNNRICGSIENRGTNVLPFDRVFRAAEPRREEWFLRFETSTAFQAREQHWNDDERVLGFALASVQSQERAPRLAAALRWLLLFPFFLGLRLGDQVCRAGRRLIRPKTMQAAPAGGGLSIVIPERANPALLARCLESAEMAARGIGVETETIVVASGSPAAQYAPLRARFPEVRWLHRAQPLAFSRAVALGMEAARQDWVYLLNNDMVLHPDCLRRLLPLRGPEVFALASQIFPADPRTGREETNWTDFHFARGVVEIFDVLPESDEPRPSFYAGGGSSLFRREVLREMIRKGFAYDPFYWEDVEWAARAWKKYSLRVLFCPASRVEHARRATVSRFYSHRETERIFQRNRFLYQLRNVTRDGSLGALHGAMSQLDWRSLGELFEPRRLVGILASRVRMHFHAADDRSLRRIRRGSG